MRKLLLSAAITGAVIALSAGSAAATSPADPSCFGEDMSHYARHGFTAFGQPVEAGDGFGHFHHHFAQDVFHGMGEPVQLHRSGAVPPGALSVYSCGGS